MVEDDIQKVSAFLSAYSEISERELVLYQELMRHPELPTKVLFKKAQAEMGVKGKGEEIQYIRWPIFIDALEKFERQVEQEDPVRNKGFRKGMFELWMEYSRSHPEYSTRHNHPGYRGILALREISDRYLTFYHLIFEQRQDRPNREQVQLEMWRQGFLECHLPARD